MAIVEELFADRTETVGTKPSAEIAYVVRQAIDENDVKNAADAAIPDFYAGLIRKSITIDERINEDTWKVTANFEALEFTEQEEEEEPVFSFDTGGGTQHISQSIQTIAKYGPQASDLLGGAIGYDGENIAGVDITIPVFNFTETHFLPNSTVTPSYKGNLFNKTGKVNSGGFRGLAAGEVLFLGAAGSKRGEDDWEITFRFAALPNKTNIQVGSIAGISKKGWEYMWVQYADDVDAAKKQIIKKPVAVYIEKVYEETSFAGLGIGD
jgi:hypothetical protein